ncbi:phosphopyruvate hydratase [Actinopolymorpha singaporensis]|uniref:Enolase n=1 Tax=Actinopolymorpha singaporensis TaxID=117157 RepID=A0A1H1L1W0_9ACTN|nr:phosphopyruvate hydratase [Actinopolymorpha singaporensis]
MELRDGDDKRFVGKGVTNAVRGVVDVIAPELVGYEASEQRLIDARLMDLDGTPNKAKLGANAARRVPGRRPRRASSADLPLFRYVGGPTRICSRCRCSTSSRRCARRQRRRLPGVHRPDRGGHLRRGTALGAETYHALKAVLKSQGLSTGLGDEGGFAPNLPSNRAALDLIATAVGAAGFRFGTDVAVAIDAAATEFYDADSDRYRFEGGDKTSEEMAAYYAELRASYPLVSLEDPLAEDDWSGWAGLTETLGGKVQLVGDDLFVTNPERIGRGIAERSANAVLIKLNQIGTLTETLDAVDMSHRAGFRTMISHRSGETEDTTIADLAVATNAGQIKTGAPAQRAGGEVQPAAADRGGAGRRGPLRRTYGVPAVHLRVGPVSDARGGRNARPAGRGRGPGRAKPGTSGRGTSGRGSRGGAGTPRTTRRTAGAGPTRTAARGEARPEAVRPGVARPAGQCPVLVAAPAGPTPPSPLRGATATSPAGRRSCPGDRGAGHLVRVQPAGLGRTTQPDRRVAHRGDPAHRARGLTGEGVTALARSGVRRGAGPRAPALGEAGRTGYVVVGEDGSVAKAPAAAGGAAVRSGPQQAWWSSLWGVSSAPVCSRRRRPSARRPARRNTSRRRPSTPAPPRRRDRTDDRST